MITGELKNKVDKIWEIFLDRWNYKSTGSYRTV